MTALALLQTALKLLSDPTRLRLVALLALEELAVHELVAITGLQQSRISNHLSLLKRSGLVRDRREGNWSFHSLVEVSDGGPLTGAMFAAAVQPYLVSAAGLADRKAVEAIREQRREQSRAAHEQLAEGWADRGQAFEAGTLRAEAMAAIVPPGTVIADLGCGAGFLTQYLADHGARVIAVDHSPAMLRAARRRVRGNVEFRRGELEALPLAAHEVDAAFCNLVWHHLANLDAAAVELMRSVRPQGSVVITDLLPHDEAWMREEMGDLRLGLKPQVVVAALARAGFTALATRTLADRYVVESKAGARAALPLFLVRGTRAASRPDAAPAANRTESRMP